MNINTLGLFLVVSGLVIVGSRWIGISLGRLPGDIVIERGNYTIMFPITTMILLSVIFSIIRHLVAR